MGERASSVLSLFFFVVVVLLHCFLLSMRKEKLCSLHMLRFELRAQNENTIRQMNSHWPKLKFSN